MKLSLFDFELPAELIAQFPARRREQSRLLVLDRKTGTISHRQFADIEDYLKPGDALVVNNTKVFKARLIGKRNTGGRVEIFLVRSVPSSGGELWEALAQPSRRLKAGESIIFGGRLGCDLVADLGGGRWQVAFASMTARKQAIAKYGHVPLPQYISRPDQPTDLRRYQTVFANPEKTGAVAAPTAGFHLTRKLIKRLTAKGVRLLEVTLHVGPGTFKPVTATQIENHAVDPEWAELPSGVAETLNDVRAESGRVFAVGTTSVRTLEAASIQRGKIQPHSGMVDLYLRPGHRFGVVDHLVTNFHLPQSSLLILVSAFADREQILAAYEEAIRERYRFYSYGDAMLIL